MRSAVPPLIRRLAPIAGTLALAAFLGAVPALAASSPHEPLVKLFNHGRLEGTATPSENFEDACGVAVDSDGDIYVSDYHHDAIDIFDSSGRYMTQIATADPGNGPCGLAVDAAGDIYVDNWRQDVVKFTPDSFPPQQFTSYAAVTIDASETATGVALDPLSGDVYVDDGTYIAEREPSGTLLAKLGEDSSAQFFGLAVSGFPATAGDVYVADAATGTVKTFDSSTSAVIEEIDGKGTPQGGFDHLVDAALAVDPTNGHVLLSDNVGHGASEKPEAVIDEFNPAGDYRGQIAHWLVKEGEPAQTVEYGLTDSEPIGLTITPQGEVLTTNGNDEGSVVDFFASVSPAHALSVVTTGGGAGTLSSKPAGISCPGACSAEYNAGEAVTLSAAPDAHSAFAGFTGCESTPTPTTCRVTMSADRAVSAEFETLPQKTLKVSLGGGGEGTLSSEPAGISCPSSCEEHFNEGSTVTLTETPAPHSRFGGWEGPACDESTATTCEVQMSGDESLSAQFIPIPQQSLEVEVSGAGSLRSQPAGISCSSACAESFDEGSTVTLTALPAAHQRLAAWGGACAGTPVSEPCEVTMAQAESVRAVFAPIQRTLTVAIAGVGEVLADHGAITACTATCAGTYLDGEVVALHAVPAAGYSFAGWSGGGCGGTVPCEEELSADVTVRANFAPVTIEAPPASLVLGKPVVKGRTATLAATVSGAGSLSATGKGLKSVHAQAAGAETLRLRLSLAVAGARALGRHGHLAIALSVTFTPAGGGAPVQAQRTFRFTAKARRHGK